MKFLQDGAKEGIALDKNGNLWEWGGKGSIPTKIN